MQTPLLCIGEKFVGWVPFHSLPTPRKATPTAVGITWSRKKLKGPRTPDVVGPRLSSRDKRGRGVFGLLAPDEQFQGVGTPRCSLCSFQSSDSKTILRCGGGGVPESRARCSIPPPLSDSRSCIPAPRLSEGPRLCTASIGCHSRRAGRRMRGRCTSGRKPRCVYCLLGSQ